MKWFLKILRKIFNVNNSAKFCLDLEGVGAPKLEPKDLASAKLSPAFGGFLVLEVTDKYGFVHYIEATDKNIGAIASYIKIYMIVRTEHGGFDLQEIDQSQKYFDIRKENIIRFKL